MIANDAMSEECCDCEPPSSGPSSSEPSSSSSSSSSSGGFSSSEEPPVSIPCCVFLVSHALQIQTFDPRIVRRGGAGAFTTLFNVFGSHADSTFAMTYAGIYPSSTLDYWATAWLAGNGNSMLWYSSSNPAANVDAARFVWIPCDGIAGPYGIVFYQVSHNGGTSWYNESIGPSSEFASTLCNPVAVWRTVLNPLSFPEVDNDPAAFISE